MSELSFLKSLIDELDWYYSNRKDLLLPIWYEDVLKECVKYANLGQWDTVMRDLNRLKTAHPDYSCGIISNR